MNALQRNSSIFGRSQRASTNTEEVPEDPEFQRHLIGENGNMVAALKRWKKTLNWRKENKVDDILERPYPLFDIFKRYYPHFYCGRTKEGRVLYIERQTEVDIKSLRDLGLTIQDLEMHYVYISEYQVKYLAPKSPDGKSVTILDIHGLRFSHIISETVSFAKRVANIAQDNYPERAHKIYVVNVPRWFDIAFTIVKPLLSEATLAKIKIYRSNFTEDLLEEVDEDVLPVRYGGKNAKSDYESQEEIDLRNFVISRLEKAGMVMEHV